MSLVYIIMEDIDQWGSSVVEPYTYEVYLSESRAQEVANHLNQTYPSRWTTYYVEEMEVVG